MLNVTVYLRMAVERNASDIIVAAGTPISAKIRDEIVQLDSTVLMPQSTMEVISSVYGMADRTVDRLLETGDDDFSFSVPGLSRFRANAYRQRGSFALVIRIIPFEIPDYRLMNIPDEVMNLADTRSGLILITGATGSGKSTTGACIIDRINRTRACHIITLEDPIEYLHKDIRSIVSQREIGVDTKDCSTALKACLRQSPDVIQLGEMSDSDIMKAALSAAETGHLLIATLHTRTVVGSIDRIIDSFPADSQQQIRIQLASVLQSVVSQKFIPGVDGKKVAAFEVMHATDAVRGLIRDSKTRQIENLISTGSSQGMLPMDSSILKLYNEGRITLRTAMDYADNPLYISRKIEA